LWSGIRGSVIFRRVRRVKPEVEAKDYVRNDRDRPGLQKQFISHEIGEFSIYAVARKNSK